MASHNLGASPLISGLHLSCPILEEAYCGPAASSSLWGLNLFPYFLSLYQAKIIVQMKPRENSTGSMSSYSDVLPGLKYADDLQLGIF